MFGRKGAEDDANQLHRPVHRREPNQRILHGQRQFIPTRHRLLRLYGSLKCPRCVSSVALFISLFNFDLPNLKSPILIFFLWLFTIFISCYDRSTCGFSSLLLLLVHLRNFLISPFIFEIGKLTGYETRIGYVDVKTSSGVYFYVGRTSTYSTTESVIPYERTQLNIGGAMNLASGVFVAPVSGRYQFNFVAVANAASTAVIFRLNGVRIAYGLGDSRYDILAFTATVSLQKNDRIDTYLSGGSIRECATTCYETQFTGILLEEDLLLS